MLKAIVSTLEELDSLKKAKGYELCLEEGDDVFIGGNHLIFVNGSLVDYEEHEKAKAEEETAKEGK